MYGEKLYEIDISDKPVSKHGLTQYFWIFKKRKTEIETVRVRDIESDREVGGTKPRKPLSTSKSLNKNLH